MTLTTIAADGLKVASVPVTRLICWTIAANHVVSSTTIVIDLLTTNSLYDWLFDSTAD